MGFFDGLLNALKLKKKMPVVEPIQQPAMEPPKTDVSTLEDESKKVDMDRFKIKMDLILTELDSLKILNQTINERLRNIESKLAEKDRIRYV